MLVKDLIAKLQEMPQDVEVIHTFHSDYVAIEDEDIELVTAKDGRFVKRDGRYILYYANVWCHTEDPGFVDVVMIY